MEPGEASGEERGQFPAALVGRQIIGMRNERMRSRSHGNLR
jgi:hypothetical protein